MPEQELPEQSRSEIETSQRDLDAAIEYASELPKFRELRLRVLAEQEQAISDRIMANPEPDEEELSASAYREQIEPQCRDAVFAMRRMGYRTGVSGFATLIDGDVKVPSAAQSVEGGDFNLSPETVENLREYGYIASGGSITFHPPKADMETITALWNQLVKLLPDQGRPARPNGDRDEFFRMAQATTPWLDWAEIRISKK